MKQFNFSGLFILDLANNHQGDVEHGINIIRAMGAALKEQGVRGGIKFQFRQLDSFIHPEYQGKKDIPHVQRFLSTRLEKNDYQRLISVVREEGLVPICTPFDEESVDLIEELDIVALQIHHCSSVWRWQECQLWRRQGDLIPSRSIGWWTYFPGKI
jgi:sialic acid synthase SpsE